MFNFSHFNIPVIESIDIMTSFELDNLRKTGFCYLKIGEFSSEYNRCSTTIRAQALNLFRSDDATKKTFSVPPSEVEYWKQRTLTGGYRDRRSNFEHLEAFRQSMGQPIQAPFVDCSEAINSYKKMMVDKLAIKLVIKLLEYLSDGTKKEYIDQVQHNLTCTLSLTYYSTRTLAERLTLKPRFNPHKDIDLITVIQLDKPGLQAWMDGTWVDILPKEGYVFALFGDQLDTITEGETRSCLHAVRMSKNEERLSTIFFVSSTISPFISLKGDFISEDRATYFKNRYINHNTESRISVKSAFKNFRFATNLWVIFISSLALARFFLLENPNRFDIRSTTKLIAPYVSGTILLNILVQIFRVTHFEKMFMDYLQYSECPKYASDLQTRSYELGKSSLSFLGMTKSFSDSSTYLHRSFWNAGFIKAFASKYASTEDQDKEQLRESKRL